MSWLKSPWLAKPDQDLYSNSSWILTNPSMWPLIRTQLVAARPMPWWRFASKMHGLRFSAWENDIPSPSMEKPIRNQDPRRLHRSPMVTWCPNVSNLPGLWRVHRFWGWFFWRAEVPWLHGFTTGDSPVIHMAMEKPLYGSVSKPCTPGEHQNSW